MAKKTQSEVPLPFTQFVQDQLRKTGMSLRQMAAAAELTPGYLSMVLRGKRGLPSDTVLRQLAEALKCPPDTLLLKAGRISPPLSQTLEPTFLRKFGNLTAEDREAIERSIDHMLQKYSKAPTSRRRSLK